MSFYDDCVAADIVQIAKPLLERGNYIVRNEDGKLFASKSISWDTPWHHVYHHGDLDCHTWHQIMFNVLFERLDKKWVPSECQQCWKVVVRPQRLLGLFELEMIQTELGRPSKCGIEIRETVCGLYGGYFYNRSIEEGRECYRIVREAVDNGKYLGPETTVLLKRGCTEFEAKCGPSNLWSVTDEQREIEDLVNEHLVRDFGAHDQPLHVVKHVQRKWIEFAYAAGDQDYRAFTDGEPLHKPYVTYHDNDPPRPQDDEKE